MLKSPSDILITTPESLFLMLTSRARETLGGVQVVIVDEVHAVAGSKRGAHLALSLERLERLVGEPVQRVGLSATQRPLEEIGRFVSGGRPIELVDAGTRKELDLRVVVPLEDMREPGEGGSIWPSIHPALLELVQEHRSTIVFVNNRRLAERLALRLNELAEKEIARAHHGSLAREQRVEVEELLKKGEIPCLVATSSLELGIDMGAVDLVIQVESPKSVARGLQRVGRAGHRLDEASKGRIFPKFRADLLESAVVAQRMKEGLIEETRVPRNPLDVLAQQIVAISAQEEIAVDELHDLVRRAWPFRDISRQQLENVLDMLAGRYPSEEFAELRPRITWDRTAGVLRGREGARRLAVTNAGTIPDRGLFGVHLVDGGGRVGELDEEMVYEARAGQTFLLGASTWRIEEITRDRVLVSPAPGVPGLVPFWKGEGVGRPYELGEAIGRAGRELVALPDAKARDRLTRRARARRARGRQPPDVPPRAGARDRRAPVRPDDRRRALPRRDRRLAAVHPHAVRGTRPRAVGARARGAPARVARARGQLHLVGRRHRAAPARRRRPAAARGAARGPGRARGPRRRRAWRRRALRGPLPGERGPRPPHPAPPARPADPALAAAPQGAGPPAGRPALSRLPGRARDVPRVPPGRLRPSGPSGAARGSAEAQHRPGRGRDAERVAVRLVAPLRLRRHVHVRGRHAARRAARPGALARSRPAQGAARPGRAARPHRPRRGGRGRGAASRARRLARPASRPAPAPRRPCLR